MEIEVLLQMFYRLGSMLRSTSCYVFDGSKHRSISLWADLTDESMEGGLASLGSHSTPGTAEPAWKHAVRSLILFVTSLVVLFVLDVIWMKGIAPALGVDYFSIIKVSAHKLTECMSTFCL